MRNPTYLSGDYYVDNDEVSSSSRAPYQAIKCAKAQVHAYSDSVLCLGKMHDHSEANEKWKSQMKEFQQSNEYAELSGIDVEPIELEWNIFPGFTLN